MAMTIERQKKMARGLLKRLEGFDAVVGGGCPRDWYQGELGNDIDIFITRSPDITAIERALGRGLTPLGDDKYDRAAFSTYETVYSGGQRVQVMVVEEDVCPKEYVLNFPANLSQAWYDGEECGYSRLFEAGMSLKICALSCMNGLYYKYCERLPYPEWVVVLRNIVSSESLLEGARRRHQLELARVNYPELMGVGF